MFKYNCCSYLKTWLKKEILFLSLFSNNHWSNKYLCMFVYFLSIATSIKCTCIFFSFCLKQHALPQSWTLKNKVLYYTCFFHVIATLLQLVWKTTVFTFHFHFTSPSSNVEYKYNYWIYLNMQYIFFEIYLFSK